MSEENKVGLQTDPNDISNIERLIKSVDKLDNSLQHLAQAGRGMNDLKQMMVTMQAAMTTGFTEMAAVAQRSGEKMVAERQKTSAQLVAEEEKAWEKLRFTSQAARSREEAAQEAANSKRLAAGAAAADKLLTTEIAAENKRASSLKALMQQRDVWEAESRAKRAAAVAAAADRVLTIEIAAENKRASSLKAAMQKQDLWEAEERGRKLAAVAAHQAKLEEITLASRARQAAANTTQAQNNSANITSGLSSNLTSSYAASRPAIASSQSAIQSHNNVMNEAHALARGLAGSLGGLWLTYGSAVPLLAGAALAASLKNVLSIGMQVESQLNFVAALGKDLNSINVDQNPFLTQRAGTSMDTFLSVSDSSLSSIREAGEAMRGLAQNGQDFTKSIALLPTIMNLATVGEMTAGQAALSLTGAISAFNLEISDAGRVADIFAKTAASSNTSVLAMTESMKQASTVASLFKVSLEDTAAMIGVLAKINITGGAAGTSITNMLTGFYEPTQQAKKALAQLGVETSLLSGELKPVPQLLEDVRAATANLNDTAKADILGRIVTVRGLKSLSTLLTNLDDFKAKQEEAATATNFMNQVVQQLEDSADGAFKRMAVTVEKDLVGAFEVANPYVQQLGQHLTNMFKDPSIKTGLGNLTTNLVQLTTALVDNLSILAMLTAGYVLYRSTIAPLIALYSAYSAAQATNAAATLAAAAAQGVHTTAVLTSTGSSAAYTAMLEAQTVATVAATGATRALSAMLIPALTTIAVLVGAVAAAWYLFSDNTTKADEANTKISNSLNVVHDALGREIERLEKVNALWNERKGNFDSAERPSADMLGKAQSSVATLEAQIRAAGQRPEDVRNPGTAVNLGMGGSSVGQVSRFSQALKDADQNLLKIKADMELFDNTVLPQRALEASRKSAAGLNTELDAFIQLGNNKNSAGVYDVQNEKVRELYLSAKNLKDMLNDPSQMIRAADSSAAAIRKAADSEKARVAALKIDLKQLNEQIQSQLQGKPVKPNTKGERDSLNAAIAEVSVAKEILKIQQQTEELRLKEQNKAGGLGDLGLMQATLVLQRAATAATIAQAQADIALVSGVENKRAATQKYNNQLAVGREQAVQDELRARINADAIIEQLSVKNLQTEAENYTKRGQLLDGFLVKYEADNGAAIKRVAADLVLVQNSLDSDPFISPADLATLTKYNDTMSTWLDNMKKAKGEGSTTAMFNETRQQLETMISTLQTSLSDAKTAGSDEGGLSGAMGVGAAAQGLRDNLMPQITELQSKLEQLASGTPALEKLAAGSAKNISKQMLELSKAAQPFGNAWTEIFKSVEGSAHNAWLNIGKKGTNAMEQIGSAIRTSILDLLYQLTIKKWIINIGASFSDGIAGAAGASLAGSAGGAAGAGGGLGSLMSMANTAKGIYSAITATGSGTLAAWLTGASSVAPTSVALANGAGAIGGDALGTLIGAEGWSTGAAGAGAASGAGGAGLSGLGAFGAVAGGAALGLVGGNAISGGYSAIGKNSMTATATGTAVGAVIGSMGGPLGTAIGAAVGGLVGGVINRAFGNKAKEMTGVTGVRGTLTEDSVSGTAYAEWQKKGGWFSSTKRGEDKSDLTSEFQNSLKSGLVSIKTLAENYAKDLGLDGKALGGYSKNFDIKLTNESELAARAGKKSPQELSAAIAQDAAKNAESITKFFSTVSDELATKLIPNISDFAKVGETAGTTLERLGADFKATNVIAQLLGKTSTTAFGAAGLASIAAREQFINLSGGIDQLSSKLTSYSSNYLSQAEQTAPVLAELNTQFAALNIKAPTTRDEFKALVTGLDLTDASQVKVFNSLMGLQQAFADTHPAMASTLTAAEELSRKLEIQAQLYEITKDQMGAAAVLEQQRAAALKQLTPELANWTKQLWAAQDAQKAAAEAQALLSIQAQLYSTLGDKAAAAAVLERQHQAALVGMTDETAKWTKALWAAEAAQAATKLVVDGLSSAYDTVQAVVSRQKDAIQKAYDEQSEAIKASIEKTKDSVTELKSLADDLKSTLANLSIPGKEKADRAGAQEQLLAALATVRAGGALPSADSLKDPLKEVSKDSTSLFSNSLDWLRDQYRTKNTVAALSTEADKQLSTAEKTLKSLEAQEKTLDKLYKDQIAVLDATLEEAKTQTDLLTGIGGSLLTLPQALAALAVAMEAFKGNAGAMAPATITKTYPDSLGRAPEAGAVDFWTGQASKGVDVASAIKNSDEAKLQALYKSLLGRTGDAAGVNAWEASLAAGVSWDQIKAGFMDSDEYKKLHPPGFANGGDHAGGLRMVGERGVEMEATGSARIWNADQMSKAVGGGNSEVADAVDSLTRKMEQVVRAVENLQKPVEDTAAATDRTAKIMKNITPEGDAVQTKGKK